MAKKAARPRNAGPGPFAEYLKPLVATAAVALAGAVGFWLTPLKDTIFYELYPEKADISLSLDRSSISPGQPVQVHVKISQVSSSPVTKGRVTLHFEPTLLSRAPGIPPYLDTSEANGVQTLDKPFVLFAGQNPGKVELFATLETRFGTHTSPRVPLELISQRDVRAPYLEQHDGSHAINLSGEWHIEIGGAHGTMKIAQDAKNNVTGTYAVETVTRGPETVDGYKDGTRFSVSLYRQDADKRRRRVEANFCRNASDPRYVEIRGCAYEVERDPAVTKAVAVERDPKECVPPPCAESRNYMGWRGVGVLSFYATAQMRQ